MAGHPRRRVAGRAVVVLDREQPRRPGDREQVGRPAPQRQPELADRRAEHEVAADHRLDVVRERQYVGRVVLAAIVAIEFQAFFGMDQADGDLTAARAVDVKRGAHPGADLRAQG